MLLHKIDGKQISLPADSNYWPEKAYLKWHREREFRNLSD
jgi:predicted restriction endonuclease